MLKNRLISALLIASLIAGVTACSTDSANENGGGTSENTVTEQNEPSGEETEGTSDEDTTGNTTETTTESTDTTSTKTTKAKKLAVPEAGEDYILFSYEYGNMAWGYQSVKMLFLNNGDVYTFENDPGTAVDKNGRDLAV